MLGLGIGVVLQRGRFCFAGAFRDLYLMRNGAMMRAILLGLAVATPGFALLQVRAVPNPGFGAALVVGGVLLGLGMVVAGGCVSGTLYRIGEGYLASWAALAGILLGLSLATHTWNAWWVWSIRDAPTIWLPAALGYGGAVGLSLSLLAAAYLAVMWWESRDSGGGPPPLPGRGPDVAAGDVPAAPGRAPRGRAGHGLGRRSPPPPRHGRAGWLRPAAAQGRAGPRSRCARRLRRPARSRDERVARARRGADPLTGALSWPVDRPQVTLSQDSAGPQPAELEGSPPGGADQVGWGTATRSAPPRYARRTR